jgi:flagellar M-ring protein FliF
MTHLVASSVPGLSPDDVSITDGNGTLLTGGPASSAKGDALRSRYEDALTAQVSSMFDTLLGPGRAVVRVSAEMDNSNTTIDSQTYDPKQSVVLSQSKTDEIYAPKTAAENGGAITSTDAAGALPTTTSTSTSSNGYSKTESTTTNGVSVTTAHKVVAPGGVKRLTVAVAVDSNAKNAPISAEIQAMVANAVGLDPSRGDSISVTRPAFLMSSEAATDAKDVVAGASPVALVTDHAPQALGALLLLLVGLGFLRAVKNGVATELPADQVTAAVEAGRRHALPSGAAAALPPLPQPRGSSDQLLGAIDDNADEVTGLIRGWLENAGSAQR